MGNGTSTINEWQGLTSMRLLEAFVLRVPPGALGFALGLGHLGSATTIAGTILGIDPFAPGQAQESLKYPEQIHHECTPSPQCWYKSL